MDLKNPDAQAAEEAAMSYPSEDMNGRMGASEIERVLQKHEQTLLAIKGVIGVGIQTNKVGNDVIVVYLRDESVRKHIPTEIDGFQIMTQVTGELEAY